MDPSFGARLRAQRERQQIALEMISADTKIKVSMLEALERDDVSQWPEGIYRRAYVRAYARAVGLDPEAMVREFLEVHPDPLVVPRDTTTELEDPEWPAGFRRLVTSTISVVPATRQPVAHDPAQSARPDPTAPAIPIQNSANSDVRTESPSSTAADEAHRLALGLTSIAALCTRLGQARDRKEIELILADAARSMNAVGMVVWWWDSRTFTLQPSLASGYADAVVARMPRVRADEDSAVASAFRTAQVCTVSGGEGLTGAVVVPLLASTGCAGVLAIEIGDGDEHREDVREVARIVAAQLVPLVASFPLAEAVNS